MTRVCMHIWCSSVAIVYNPDDDRDSEKEMKVFLSGIP